MLDGCGERFARVGGLGGGETDELGAGEGEGGGDEDGAETLEAVVEGAGVLPEAPADVACVGTAVGGSAPDVDDDAEDDEADDGDDFDGGEDELCLAVAADAEQVDGDDQEEEERDEAGDVQTALIPELDGQGRGDDFER